MSRFAGISFTSAKPVVSAMVLGIAAAQLCVALGTPLPWMIGPLFGSAALRLCGADLRCPTMCRGAGQWAIGTALGLYFTPEVIALLAAHAGAVAAAVGFALLLGAGCGELLHRFARVDRTTAFFAMAIGGASEMANQGERHGALVDRVAAAHSLRLMLVVAVIPFALQSAGVAGVDPFQPGARAVDYGGLIALIGATCAAALLLRRLGWPNAWVIGPLLVAIGLTANGLTWSALPETMVHVGQLFIGLSLGTRFTPAFLATAPRYLASVAACVLMALAAAAGFGAALAHISGMHWATAILATSPGGIAEMSLTAKTLQLGVPIVTAFHVTRMAALVLLIGPVYRIGRRVARA